MPSAPVTFHTPLMSLCDGIVYGPVTSRRLGCSLGINLLPAAIKTCNFNCVYCQYGWTPQAPFSGAVWPASQTVRDALEGVLADHALASRLTRITLAGHGEPTLHPAFADIVDLVCGVRARLAPGVVLAILSNGTRVHLPDIRAALLRLDERYIKLDAGDQATLRRMNASRAPFETLVESVRTLPDVVLQSMFVDDPDGRCGNATPAAVAAWLDAVRRIHPTAVHLYTLARRPALARLRGVSTELLETLAGQLRAEGVRAEVFV